MAVSIVIGNPLSIRNYFSIWMLNFNFSLLCVYCWRSQHPLHAKKRPYLPRYRRTASISTYTHTPYRGVEHCWLVYVCVCVKIEYFEFWDFCTPVSLVFCLSVSVSSFLLCLSLWWTLGTTAGSFSPYLCLEMMRMMSLHHRKWTSCFETKRKHPFLWFWTIKMILQ